MSNDCNSINGIRAYLRRGLMGLHELQAARRARWRDYLSLQSFLVLGSIYLDEEGGMYRLRFTNWKHGADMSWLPQALPDVLPLLQLETVLPGATYEYSVNRFLPMADQTCSHCGQRWTIDTIEDAYKVGMASGNDCQPIYQHLRCLQLDGEHRAHEWGVASATEAGFIKPVVRVVPNEYWPDAYVVERAREPWCVLATRWGDLKFGWRKRVISLSWADVAAHWQAPKSLDAAVLFPTEEVTRDGPLIHAWGQDKFVEYLRVLRAAFEANRV